MMDMENLHPDIRAAWIRGVEEISARYEWTMIPNPDREREIRALAADLGILHD